MSREALFDILEVRFDTPVPESVSGLINRIEDVSILKDLLSERDLLKKVAEASSPDEFRLVLENMRLS